MSWLHIVLDVLQGIAVKGKSLRTIRVGDGIFCHSSPLECVFHNVVMVSLSNREKNTLALEDRTDQTGEWVRAHVRKVTELTRLR